MPDPDPFYFADFLARAGSQLRRSPPSLGDARLRRRGDDDLNDALMAMPAEPAVRHAAVLVPVADRAGAASVLLTQRASALRDHSGQIAFPGGKIDRADGTPLAAALREAEEEIGLDRRFVRPLGYLDPYLSRTGFLIIPVVAALGDGFSLAINPAEVDDAFEVPLAFLMDVANHQRHSRTGRARCAIIAAPYGDRYIWGVTAGIIRNLYERLLGSGPAAVRRRGQRRGRGAGAGAEKRRSKRRRRRRIGRAGSCRRRPAAAPQAGPQDRPRPRGPTGGGGSHDAPLLEELVLFPYPLRPVRLFPVFRRRNPFTREPWTATCPGWSLPALP
jgi:8-oxo-dGTP pyrophosphatase MutT (NUDIX family)